MDKSYVQQGAEDFAHSLCLDVGSVEFEDTVESFRAGAKWMQEKLEEIEVSKNR